MSNITSYGRVRLVVEVLRRVFRILSEDEQSLNEELFTPYLKKSSSKYVYDLNSKEATVKEYTKNMNHKGKFKVRGRFKVALHATAMSISINLGRIYRLFRKNGVVFPVFVQIYLFLSINRVFYLKNKAII